uniref:Uncharacterized protein n=1 Tax=Aotus nancymaae TaxID=37293 RepID=A0A2K5EQI2_AOTNA
MGQSWKAVWFEGAKSHRVKGRLGPPSPPRSALPHPCPWEGHLLELTFLIAIQK